MTDTAAPQGLSSDAVLVALRGRGFECEVVGDHVVATRDATRLVIPGPGRTLPVTFTERLEHAMRPLLGRDWIESPPSAPPPPVAETSLDVRPLDAVVDRCTVSGQWCAFLPSEVTVMGFGPTRDEALRDLAQATALWIGISAGTVELVTVDGA